MTVTTMTVTVATPSNTNGSHKRETDDIFYRIFKQGAEKTQRITDGLAVCGVNVVFNAAVNHVSHCVLKSSILSSTSRHSLCILTRVSMKYFVSYIDRQL